GNFIPFDSFNNIKHLYKFAKENNVKWLYNEACLDHEAGTAFTFLKGYLQSKLGWKTDLDVECLEKKFFAAMYGSQKDRMYSVYKDMKAYCKRQTEEEGFPRFHGSRELFYPGRWDKDVMQSMYDRMVKAENALVANGEYKEARHVQNEQIYPLGVLVRCFRDDYTRKEHIEMLEKLRRYLFEFGFVTLGCGEIGWVPRFFEMLGIDKNKIWKK
ncbi:MAG: DUF4838 domain-containing protein, partial [Clostridia bacterium]|nr:DUF4838 domain-containing protein [Clostridia bacterium]